MNESNHINSTIKCSVANCTYHNGKDYCSLNQIHVGACNSAPTSCAGTECASFQMGNEGGCR